MKNLILLLFLCASSQAQWHPIGPQKVEQQEAYLYFYDYFFEAEKAEEISIFRDSLFFLKMDQYRSSRPSYLLEVYLPEQRLYRYYALRFKADEHEIAVIESNYKQLLKDLIKEADYQKLIKKTIVAHKVPYSYFYSDQFYFSTKNNISVETSRDEVWRKSMLPRDSLLKPFLSIISQDLARKSRD